MTLDQLSQILTWGLYLVVFAVVVVRAVRNPIRANVDIALLFGTPGVLILVSALVELGLAPTGRFTNAITSTLLLGMIYMLVRLVNDFMNTPIWIVRASEAALVIIVVSAFVAESSTGLLFDAEIAYCLTLLVYVSAAFIVASRRSGGVTRRRMIAIAFGTLSLLWLIVFASLIVAFPNASEIGRDLTEATGLASAIAYYLGFATPAIIRRAWQGPELRIFLQRAATLPRLPNTDAIVRELENGAAISVGAPNASIGIWNEANQQLLYRGPDGERLEIPLDPTSATGSSFVKQTPVFVREIKRNDPAYTRAARSNVATILAAPITAGQRRLGILAVYADRTPIFADEDLELIKLLADQAAVVLESRALIDEAVKVRAQEQATRLKEDFLSAAAHDLKTPLTILVGQAELMERRAIRNPDAPADIVGIRRLTKEAHRLKTLVLELLDAARTEQGNLVSGRAEVDLVATAEETCERHNGERHVCTIHAAGPVIGMYDPIRIQQLLENLMENAVKYSPEGGPIEINIWGEHSEGTGQQAEASWNHVTVTDHGIGIPAEDLPNVFERFHRGTNVDDRNFVGMGLGLYICKGIAEQHGGRISVESRALTSTNSVANNGANNGISKGTNNDVKNANGGSWSGTGTTFHIVLPAENHAILPEAAATAS